MDNAGQPLPQPNFTEAAESLHTVANHLSLCGNLPSIDAGAQLLAMMRTQINSFERLERKVDGLERNFERLERKVDALERKVDASDRRAIIMSRNMAAKQWNSTATQLPNELEPLYSPETGELIEDCPSTVQALDSLATANVDKLLRALNEPVNGRVEARRRRLALAFGVTILHVRR